MRTKTFLCVFLIQTHIYINAQEPFILKTDELWEMVYSDEFNGDALDWHEWESENPDNIKRNTYRGKENVSVEHGELRLNVTKESRKGSIWSAASIFLKKPLEHNSYIECRFRTTQCTGVNNAFWLACRTNVGTTFNNRYEIDIVESKKDKKTGMGNAHLAWHDWKTSGYALDSKGKKCDIAQGISITHSNDEYHIWGLWYGENDIVYYLDGKPVWTGKTHQKYPEQWKTGIGKAPEWDPVEEKRAYGNYGQDDWSYRGGYNGDSMNILLSTLPWDTPSSPLTDEADGTYMAIDYIRVFKPSGMIVHTPDQHIDEIPDQIRLNSPSDLCTDRNYYYSFTFRPSKEDIVIDFIDREGISVCKSVIRPDGEITARTGCSESSTVSAFPACEKKNVLKGNREYLAIVRITAKVDEKDAMSIKIFDTAHPGIRTEPYFYPNIDSKGNTSITNEWDINAKDYSDDKICGIRISGGHKISDFRSGKHYSNILPVK